MAMALLFDFHLPAWLGHPVELRRPAGGEARGRIGPWTLQVKRDGFTGQVTCSLVAPRMSFDHAAVTFRFSPRTETFDAIYRVDAGPAHSWRPNAMALAAHGVQLQSDDARNPSGGRVTLPYTALVGGKTVWIRPSAKARAWPFRIEELTSAVNAAKSSGCGADFTGPVSE